MIGVKDIKSIYSEILDFVVGTLLRVAPIIAVGATILIPYYFNYHLLIGYLIFCFYVYCFWDQILLYSGNKTIWLYYKIMNDKDGSY